MSYPIIICEDQFLQLQQLESIIQNYILFHSEIFQIKLKTQSPIEHHFTTFHAPKGIKIQTTPNFLYD